MAKRIRIRDRQAEYEKHKDKIKARVKKWVAENKDRSREYHREYAKLPEQRKKVRSYRAEWTVRNKERVLLKAAEKRARLRGFEFDIEISDVVIPSHCPLLGIPLVRDCRMKQRANSPSLDRLDSSKGYIKGNVWVISWRANAMKNAAEPAELVRFAKALLSIFDKQ